MTSVKPAVAGAGRMREAPQHNTTARAAKCTSNAAMAGSRNAPDAAGSAAGRSLKRNAGKESSTLWPIPS
jgi:hypothetical protein